MTLTNLLSSELLNTLINMWKSHWQLIIFIVVVSIGIKLIFNLLKTALYIIKARIIYHYVAILVMSLMPIIEDFLLKRNIELTIPTFAGINLTTIVIGLVTLNLTRIISKQVFRRF